MNWFSGSSSASAAGGEPIAEPAAAAAPTEQAIDGAEVQNIDPEATANGSAAVDVSAAEGDMATAPAAQSSDQEPARSGWSVLRAASALTSALSSATPKETTDSAQVPVKEDEQVVAADASADMLKKFEAARNADGGAANSSACVDGQLEGDESPKPPSKDESTPQVGTALGPPQGQDASSLDEATLGEVDEATNPKAEDASESPDSPSRAAGVMSGLLGVAASAGGSALNAAKSTGESWAPSVTEKLKASAARAHEAASQHLEARRVAAEAKSAEADTSAATALDHAGSVSDEGVTLEKEESPDVLASGKLEPAVVAEDVQSSVATEKPSSTETGDVPTSKVGALTQSLRSTSGALFTSAKATHEKLSPIVSHAAGQLKTSVSKTGEQAAATAATHKEQIRRPYRVTGTKSDTTATTSTSDLAPGNEADETQAPVVPEESPELVDNAAIDGSALNIDDAQDVLPEQEASPLDDQVATSESRIGGIAKSLLSKGLSRGDELLSTHAPSSREHLVRAATSTLESASQAAGKLTASTSRVGEPIALGPGTETEPIALGPETGNDRTKVGFKPQDVKDDPWLAGPGGVSLGPVAERETTCPIAKSAPQLLTAQCWRCGQTISADVDAIELHSATCKRPCSRIEEIDIDELVTEGDAFLTEASADDVAHVQSAKRLSQHSDPQPDSGETAVAETTPSGKWDTLKSLPGGALAVGGALAAGVGAAVRTKASALFVKDSLKAPEEGTVSFQNAHSGCFLAVADSPDEAPSAGAAVISVSDRNMEQAKWLIVKTQQEGVVGIKSLHSGLFLCVSEELKEQQSEGGQVIELRSSSMTELSEWRIKVAAVGLFFLQSVRGSICLGTTDVADVIASVAGSDHDRWRIAIFEEGAEGEQPATSSSDPTPELTAFEVYTRFEGTVERLVLLMLDPVLHGIPKLNIPPVRTEAQRQLAEHGGNVEDTIAALQAKADLEDADPGMSSKVVAKVSELLVLRFLPFVGSGAYLSYTVYSRLRLAALVAEIYGHDAEDPQVQSQLLFCILPQGGETAEAVDPVDSEETASVEGPGGNKLSGLAAARGPVIRSAKALSHGLTKTVLKRATGWKTAADLYDLAAAVCSEKLRQQSETQEKVEGAQQACIRKAIMLFKPSMAAMVKQATLYMLALGAALPALSSVLRHSLRISRLVLTLPMGMCLLAALLVCMAVGAYFGYFWAEEYLYEHPEIFTSAVLTGHAALPLLAAFDASAMMVNGLSRRLLASESGQDGAGLVFLLMGVWSILRTVQRCQAEPGTPESRGVPTMQQKALFGIIVAVGLSDISGTDGLGGHSLPSFGALRSHHWFVALLQANALECQLRLLVLLKDRNVLLKILGATRLMALTMALFLGGLTASVGFLVSRNEFSKFVDELAPPPRVTAVILALRQRRAGVALLLGAWAGLVYQLPPSNLLWPVVKALGTLLGAGAVGICAAAFEEHREMLVDASGARWLLILPETSDRVRFEAKKVWSRMRLGAVEIVAERGAAFAGRALLDRVMNYGGDIFGALTGRGVEGAVEALADGGAVEALAQVAEVVAEGAEAAT